MKDTRDNQTKDWIEEVDVKYTDEFIEEVRLKAFLDTISITEGTSIIEESDNGYNVMVGGKLFDSYQDHPRVVVDIPSYGVKSSAAGRYQILERYWDHYSKQLGLDDFSPENQDQYAINMFRETGCLDDIKSGNIETAVKKCASRWASLPGAGYGQHEYSMSDVLDIFEKMVQNRIHS